MRDGSRIFSLLVIAISFVMLGSCGQSSNCNGISFGTTGSGGSGSSGRINSGGSVCGSGNSNNSGSGSTNALVYYIGGGAVIDAAAINNTSFAIVSGYT